MGGTKGLWAILGGVGLSLIGAGLVGDVAAGPVWFEYLRVTARGRYKQAVRRCFGAMRDPLIVLVSGLLLVLITIGGCGGAGVPSIPEVDFVAFDISGTSGKRWTGLVFVEGQLKDSPQGTTPACLPPAEAVRGLRQPICVGYSVDKKKTVEGRFQKQDPGDWELTVCVRVTSAVRSCETTTAESGVVIVRTRV